MDLQDRIPVLRTAYQLRDQLRHSVYLEEHAEHLYQTCALCDRLGTRPLTWEQLPAFEKARYISAAAQTVETITAVQS